MEDLEFDLVFQAIPYLSKISPVKKEKVLEELEQFDRENKIQEAIIEYMNSKTTENYLSLKKKFVKRSVFLINKTE